MQKRSLPLLLTFSFALFTMSCSSNTTLQPIGGSSSRSAGNISLHVSPFLAPEALPQRIIDNTTPLLAYIVNDSNQTLRISPMNFSLLVPGRGVIQPIFSPAFESSPAPIVKADEATPVQQTSPEPGTQIADPASETGAIKPEPEASSPTATPAAQPKDTPSGNTSSRSEQTRLSGSTSFGVTATSGQSHAGSHFHTSTPHTDEVRIARLGPTFHGGGVRVAPSYSGYRGFGGGVRVAPSYSGYRGFGGGVRVAPSYSGYRGFGGYRYYHPSYRPYYRPYYYGVYGYGYGYYPEYAALGIYAPYDSGYGYPYGYDSDEEQDMFLDSSISTAQIMEQRGLPAMNLAPKQRASGFLYFPKLDLKPGTRVELIWQIQDEKGQTIEKLSIPVVVQKAND